MALVSFNNPLEITILGPTICIAVFSHVSINELDYYDISIVPNPIDNDFTIFFDNLKYLHISIDLIDLSGVKLFSIFDGKLDIGLKSFNVTEQLTSGTYYVRFVINDSKVVRKIIKN